MSKEKLIKNQFPNDEFLQSAVMQIVTKCTIELENKIADIKANCDLTIEGRDIKIKELVRKNDRLEKDFRICEQNADTYYDQLTKAKEIIKELIDLGKIWLSEEDDDYSFIEQAEQFLEKVK